MEVRRKAVYAAVMSFLQNGYRRTTIRDICKKAGISSSSLFNVYKDKEAILFDLVAYMFSSQFQIAEELLEDGFSPVLLYALETSIQLAETELDENIRDIYVAAYTLPTTSAYIYRRAARELLGIFGGQIPEFDERDFYECEIGTGNMMRGYISLPCDKDFTLEKKIRRFLELSLTVYRVAETEKQKAIEKVLGFDLRSIGEKIIESIKEYHA